MCRGNNFGLGANRGIFREVYLNDALGKFGGKRDFADMIAEGGEMVEPLRDPAFFTRVFLDDGILTWPNGFDLDSIALHTEMKERGLLDDALYPRVSQPGLKIGEPSG